MNPPCVTSNTRKTQTKIRYLVTNGNQDKQQILVLYLVKYYGQKAILMAKIGPTF